MRTFAVTDPTTEEASEAMLSIFAEATFLADAAEVLASLENDAAGVAIDSLINDEAEGTAALSNTTEAPTEATRDAADDKLSVTEEAADAAAVTLEIEDARDEALLIGAATEPETAVGLVDG